MSMQEILETKLNEAFHPSHLEVLNESHMHNVPPGSESHFKVIVVSEKFSDQSLVQRHQTINALLKEELVSAIHALSLQTLTPKEWAERNQKVESSPPCLGGSKNDN
jgi:BolA protein